MAAWNTLIKAEGWRAAAERIAAEPELLDRLLGRDGLFASRGAERERASAVLAARWVGYSTKRIVEVEQRAERDYRASVTAQMARDKVGVPKLSAEAASGLEAVHAAASEQHLGEAESRYWAQKRGRAAVAQAWEERRRNPAIAAEIDRFEEAAMERLGSEGVAAALRHARGGVSLAVPGVGPEQWHELGQVARGLNAAQRGRGEHDIQRSMEARRQRESLRETMRQRHAPSLGR